jgi:hypothetical protein
VVYLGLAGLKRYSSVFALFLRFSTRDETFAKILRLICVAVKLNISSGYMEFSAIGSIE